MLTREQAAEIIRTLSVLPAEKVAEVQDFALFLKGRCGGEEQFDESDMWTDEDIHDVTLASLAYAAATLPGDADGDD